MIFKEIELQQIREEASKHIKKEYSMAAPRV